ncbi:MAG TPA: Hsp20/alpha crystallin family protein [Steroidobacteraceae bacterium]|nr:Hsp20/alpha crystallin family protein [Steroidobacteraceae bacterium]
MSLIRWEPISAMDDMFKGFPAWFGRWPRLPGSPEAGTEWAPSVDISETGSEYLIRASLPGVKKEDAKVTYEDGMLTLSGERQQQEEEKDEKFHKVESFYGSFSRSFALPEAIDDKAIRAESKDGVLTVHVPKTRIEARKPTTIKVQ